MVFDYEENATFQFILEIVINQIMIEFVFVKSVFDELNSKIKALDESKLSLEFLYLYEHFVWKGKRTKEVYNKLSRRYKRKFSELVVISKFKIEELGYINDKLVEHRDAINEIKFRYNDVLSFPKLYKRTNNHFRQQLKKKYDFKHKFLHYSKRNVINRFITNPVSDNFLSTKRSRLNLTALKNTMNMKPRNRFKLILEKENHDYN